MSREKLTVAGGGVLGSQIAFQSAFRGKDVTIWLRSEGSIDRAKSRIEKWKNAYHNDLDSVLENLSDSNFDYPRGLIDDFDSLTEEKVKELKDQVDYAFENLKYETDMAKAFEDADVVIEAVAEIPDEKKDFYQKMSKHLPEKTIVATNSSTLLPSSFADDTGRPEKFLSLHFANTVWRNNIGEVMVHDRTDEEAKEAIVEFAKEIGMVPVVLNKEQSGYILNSLLVPLINASHHLLVEKISSPEDIDKTWRISTKAPLGPFEILDIIGFTTPLNLGKSKPEAKEEGSVQNRTVKLYEKLIEEGIKGRESGKGYYIYDEDGNNIGVNEEIEKYLDL